MTIAANSADDLVADFRERARICRTNADAFDTNAAAIWDMAADAAEKLSSRQPDLVEVEAADEITRLRAALKEIEALCPNSTGSMTSGALAGLLFNIENHARQALQETGDERN
jgi:hypothetical protein